MKHSFASLLVLSFRHVTIVRCVFLTMLLFLSELKGSGAGFQVLNGHVPAAVRALTAEGELAGTKQLNLAIGLPLRNTAGLSNMLEQIYNPASSNYHHYLTPEQFTEKFGPTSADYEAVVAFAVENHLQVTARHPNRMLVDVRGSVTDVERALHIKFHAYRHPIENRTFYAPDTEPTLDLNVPVLHISGLDDYVLPKPLYHITPTRNAQPQVGSGPGGAYLGNDFRAAYIPGVNLTGSGQSVGLFQYESGYYQSDITAYETQAHLPNVPVQTVLLDGYGGGPGRDTLEVSLDIEMAMAMAPAISNILVFEGYVTDDILNAMAASNQVKQLSASWSYSIDATSIQIFQQFAAQGQSFFNASGDSDAWVGGVSSPSDNPYITIVGGTTLTTGSSGAWASETVWNRGNGAGSGGGISAQYSIPSWQTNINMTANQGSTTMRNIPDVAMVAEDIWITCSNGSSATVGGTSCATPLWAGFAALVNQEAASNGVSSIGFINPAIYALGAESNYSTFFHDITTGNNTSSKSPNLFYAVPGYDLCTGWGTPAGQNLIDVLADTEPLVILPAIGFGAIGGMGGPFTPTFETLTLTNHGTNTLSWTLVNTSSWLSSSSIGGSLAPGGPASTVVVGLNNTASNLAIGTYTASVWFTNLNDGVAQGRSFSLSIITPPVITDQPTNQLVLDGATANFNVTATGGMPLYYRWLFNGTNLTDGGNIIGSAAASLVISAVSAGQIGTYSVVVSNYAGIVISSNALLSITSSAPVITQQPSNAIAMVGATVSFGVAAIGSKPFYYQWFFDSTNLLIGATNSTLTLTDVQPTNVGSYSVVLTNTLGSVLSSNASLMLNPCDSDFSGLVAWWRAEGNTLDSAGTNDGIAVGPLAYATGEVGLGFSITSAGAYVDVPGSSNLDVGVTNGFTIEMWINPEDVSIQHPLAEWGTGGQGSGQLGPLLWISVNMNDGSSGPGDLLANIVDTSTTSHIFHSVVGLVQTNIFQHVALTYDKTTGNAVLYYNGVVAVSANLGIFTPDTAAGDLLFGHRIVTDETFPGVLDEISLYDRALSSNEISAVYNAGRSGKCFTPQLPVILVQPTNQTVNVGGTAVFSVMASGTPPLSYQWTSNEVSIVNATNSTLVLDNVQLAQNGVLYAVLVANPYSTTGSSNAVLAVNPPPPCDPAPSGLVSWWPAEGNGNDIVSGNDGILENGAGFTNGEVGMAFNLNGVSQYVLVNSSNLNIGLGSGLAIEGWINPTSMSNHLPIVEYERVLSSANPADLGVQFYTSEVTTGDVLANVVDTTGAGHLIISSSGKVSAGSWHHIALCYDKISGGASIYVNGVVVVQTNLGSFTPQTSFANLLLGARTYGGSITNPSDKFFGQMDEMSIYSRALSSNEVAAIYGAGISGKCVSSLAPVITVQPTNQNVNAGVTVSFEVVATGALPLNYQWYFNGTNLLAGATNATFALTNVLLTNAGSYVVTVTNIYGMVISTNAMLTVNDILDHFAWNPIPSPRFINVPFAVTIQSRGTTNGIFTNFSGAVLLTTTNGILVNPFVSSGFVQGVWTGTVGISKATTNLVLEASDGSGHIGYANSINVLAPPSLGTELSGNNTLLLYWPTDPAGFVLENSPCLVPAQWVPVSTLPLQLGSEYLESLQMTDTNEFYRLRFTLP